MKTLREILGFCVHKWIETERIKRYNDSNEWVGYSVFLICEKCGDEKSKKL